jgi:hypothetical protein
MRTRCRNGDIAIIVRELPGLEANVGRLVWVYGPPRHDRVFGFEWEVAIRRRHQLRSHRARRHASGPLACDHGAQQCRAPASSEPTWSDSSVQP